MSKWNQKKQQTKNGFADLMARMERGEKASAPGMEDVPFEEQALREGALKIEETAMETRAADINVSGAKKTSGCGCTKVRRRALVVLAATLVLVLGLGAVSFGEKVYRPTSVRELKDGEVILKINNEERIAREIEENEIYDEIEKRLGIRALRLGYKPAGMELYHVEILEEVGEARIELLFEGKSFALYMSRNYSDVGIGVKSDGPKVVVDTVDNFWMDAQFEVLEIDDQKGNQVHLVEIETEYEAYVVDGSIDYEEFLKIISEIYVKNV